MISKLFVFILTLFIVANANGNPDRSISCETRLNKIPTIHDGFYGGLTLGYNNLIGQLNRTNVNMDDRVTSVGGSSVSPGIFAGYQKIIDKSLYIAAEGFYQYTNILIEKQENTFPHYLKYFTYIKKSHKTGIVGKVGFVHSNNLFYLKTGLVLSNFILGFNDNGCNICFIQGQSSQVSRINKGIIFGGGIDYFINRKFGIGMEYDITTYSSMNFKSNNVGSFSFKPTSHTFQLRFKYTL